jgi:hypothetical protein
MPRIFGRSGLAVSQSQSAMAFSTGQNCATNACASRCLVSVRRWGGARPRTCLRHAFLRNARIDWNRVQHK